jgi:ATP-dependent RNA helicase DeaD
MNQILFKELGLNPELIKAIDELGFEAATPIQAECIPHIMAGKDVVGQAQTGTGKTAAFGIPAIEIIDPSIPDPQVLIMCPTRELAIQVTGELMKLAKYSGNMNIVPVYGGQPIDRQLRALRKGAAIVVGTPGRLIDHLKRKTLKLSSLKMVILDEADEMLDMGFREDIEEILSYSDGVAQKIMFSATVPSAIRDIMSRWMNNPEMVKIDRQQITAVNIQQFVMEVRDSVRTEAISRILDVGTYKLALIFCNTKRQCDELVQQLQSRGYSSDALHGDMTQGLRDKVMGKFRRNEIDILVATDVAARGLDVENIDVVFNYDIPHDPEYYVHRIGRTGRAGRSGVAITFASGRKNRRLQFIEKQIRQQLIPMSMPTTEQVQELRMEHITTEIEDVLLKGNLRSYIEQIEIMAAGDYTAVEIAAAMLKMKAEEKPPVEEIPVSREEPRDRGYQSRGNSRGRSGSRGGSSSRGGNSSGGSGRSKRSYSDKPKTSRKRKGF